MTRMRSLRARAHRTTRSQSYRPLLSFLEGRELPGDTLLGQLVLQGLLPTRTTQPPASQAPPERLQVVREPEARESLIAASFRGEGARGFSLTFALGGDDFAGVADPLAANPFEETTEPSRDRQGSLVSEGPTSTRSLGGDAMFVAGFGPGITGGTTRPESRPVGGSPLDPGALEQAAGLIWERPPTIQTPNMPVITEPSRDGQIVSGADVHMETGPFSDPRTGATHAATEWEIYTVSPVERVWFARPTSAPSLTHIHLADGTFEGSHTGRSDLVPSTPFLLRVRFENNFGETSEWAERTFVTAFQDPGEPDRRWAIRQEGYRVEQVASNFKLPVNIAFVPNPTFEPGAPLYYVTELYGVVQVVTTDGTVSRYAGGDAQIIEERPFSLLNFNPTGQFPGAGEQGVTGIVVDPDSGDVFVSLVYSLRDFDDTAPHYGRVVRLHSEDGGLTAATRTVIFDTAGPGEEQGQSHQISNLSIGPDSKLYVHNGEGFDASRAQRFDRFGGKVLRMNLDGTPCVDNPFFEPEGVVRQPSNYIFAMGFRNPFAGAWRASDGTHWEAENGPDRFDRLARVDAGENYGWNGNNRSMTTRAAYNWFTPTAPVNLTFVQPETFFGSGFPVDKWDHLFASESGPTYGNGPQQNGKRISEFILDEDGNMVRGPTPLVEYVGTGRSSVVALTAGHDGLYFSDFYREDGVGGPTARGANIYRVSYVGKADFVATVTASAEAPLDTVFIDLSDPVPVEWLWDFGDGTHSEEQYVFHQYEQPGVYNVTLTTIDGAGISRRTVKQRFVGVGRVGLRGDYFNFGDFQDFAPNPRSLGPTDLGHIHDNGTGPRLARTDATINFNWNALSPDPLLRRTNFFVSWTGLVHTRAAGTYAFTTRSDDGVRLWVNNQLVIDRWVFRGATSDTAMVTLDADTAYDIRVDYFQGGGDGIMELRWTPPGQAQEIIPAGNLSPSMQSTAVTPPSNLRLSGQTETYIDLLWTNNHANASELLVQRSTDGTTWETVASLEDLSQQSYRDRPAKPGRYFYRIRAANEVGGSNSNVLGPILFQLPAAPSNLRFTAVTGTQVTLQWNDNSPNEAGFIIERSPDGTTFTPHATVGPDVTTFTETVAAGLYYYRVRSTRNGLDSAPSNVDGVAIGGHLIDHSGGFTSTGRLVRNGNAAFAGTAARVVPAANNQVGSIFTNYRVGITNFTAEFTFRIFGGSAPKADGLTFVVQGMSPTAIGVLGNGLGYGAEFLGQPPAGIRNSAAIKFDIYEGGVDNSTGLFSDGRCPCRVEAGTGDVFNPIDPAVVDLGAERAIRVNMTYNGTTLTVIITDPSVSRSVTHNYTVDLRAKVGGLPVAYVGFTAGTGGLNANHDVQNWRFQAT